MKLLIAAALVGTALSASAASQSHSGSGACYTRVPGAEPAPMAPGGVWTLERGSGPGAVWRFDQGPDSPGVGPGWAAVDCESGRPLGRDMHVRRPTPPPGDVFIGAPRPPVMAQGAPHGERRAIIIRPHPRMHGRPVPPMAETPAPDRHHLPVMEHGPGAMPPVAHHRAPPMAAPRPHHAPPMTHVPPHVVVVPAPHRAPPMAHHAPHHPTPPMIQPAPHPMPPLAHGPMTGSMMEPPLQPFAFAPEPAPPPTAPRWFGDRYLTWQGKPPL